MVRKLPRADFCYCNIKEKTKKITLDTILAHKCIFRIFFENKNCLLKLYLVKTKKLTKTIIFCLPQTK